MKHFFPAAFLLGLLTLLIAPAARAQTSPYFTTYWTGDPADAQAQPQGGVCLMGGATEHDSASAWFVRRAGGGDVVVLRSTGADGYNQYFYNGLPGARPNSVLTVVCTNRQGSYDPWLVQQVRNAEGIWLAGGDQADYINFWKNTPLHDALRYAMDSARAVFGGTSAGCAVLGNAYYSALNGSVTSAQALANPFDPLITLGANDFLQAPALGRVLTDTHFEARNRQGRLVAFLARLMAPGAPATADPFVKGIGIEEYTAVCVEPNGQARVFGDGSTGANPDVAWFVGPACAAGMEPENLTAGQPLTWNRGGAALSVYRVLGTPAGVNTFNLNSFNGTGGAWEYWSVQNGILGMGAPAPVFVDCRPLGGAEAAPLAGSVLYVAEGQVHNAGTTAVTATLYSVLGARVGEVRVPANGAALLPKLAAGVYVLRSNSEMHGQRLLVE
jgi:cyanophycinase